VVVETGGGEIGHDEIRALRHTYFKSCAAQYVREKIALGLIVGGEGLVILVVQAERDNCGGLQRRGRGKGDELMRAADAARQIRRGEYPTEFPTGEAERLAVAAHGHSALGHAGD